MHGKGLSLHTYQDQNIDYDNSIYGIESTYHINDKFDFFTIMGRREIISRISPIPEDNPLSIDNRLISIGTYCNFDRVNFHYLSMLYEQYYQYDDIYMMKDLSSLLGDYIEGILPMIENDTPDYSMKNIEHNFGFNYFNDFGDLSYERSLIYYHKILGERETGSREYFSTYINFYGINIILEHKDYNTPYLYSLFSNPPIGYRESTSILSSRNVHTLDFNNEFGHQLEINKSFDSGTTILFNYAFAMHHKDDNNIKETNIYNLYGYMKNLLLDKNYMHKFQNFNPYRQLYLEFSGWDKEEEFYYRFGYDYIQEYLATYYILAKTLPMQFVYKLNQGNSVNIYFEIQDKWKDDVKSSYWYFSPSYSHYGEWSFSLFFDKQKNADEWIGVDYTININNLNQLSLFYGSQQGGLVCANGSCVIQPEFDEGVKVTYRTSF